MLYRMLIILLAATAVVYAGVDAAMSVLEARLAAEPASGAVVRERVREDQGAGFKPFEAYAKVGDSRLFGKLGAPAPTAPEPDPVPEVVPVTKADLGLELVGTIMTLPGEKDATARAIIEDKRQREQNIYVEGDTVGDVRIKRIERFKVIIDNDGTMEALLMDLEDDGAPTTAGRQPDGVLPRQAAQPGDEGGRVINLRNRISQAQLERLYDDPVDTVSKDVMLSQALVAGEFFGMQVNRIRPGGIFSAMQLRRGDVIYSVNGTNLFAVVEGGENAVRQGIETIATNMLTAESGLTLGVKRGSKEVTYEYVYE